MEKVFFLNVQSPRSHHDQLKLLIESFQTKPALVALCETWLSDNDPIDICELHGYSKIVTAIRQTLGGGVGCYIREGIIYTQRCLKTILEHIVIRLQSNIGMTNVVIIYRPPSTNFHDFY